VRQFPDQSEEGSAMVEAVDGVEIHVLVDNATDSLSSIPKFAESEFNYLRRNGMRILSGKCICCANHDLSCLITARRGSLSHAVLFDTGPEAAAFEQIPTASASIWVSSKQSFCRTGTGITPAECFERSN
jgi:hypothetical protein